MDCRCTETFLHLDYVVYVVKNSRTTDVQICKIDSEKNQIIWPGIYAALSRSAVDDWKHPCGFNNKFPIF